MRKKILVAFAILHFSGLSGAAQDSVFSAEQNHCAAWKTEKRLALVSTVVPIGRNCNIVVEFKSNGDKQYFVNVIMPINKFDSESKSRDSEVQKILGADKIADLSFVSESLTLPKWEDLLSHQTAQISGVLSWHEKSYPVTFDVELSRVDEKLFARGRFIGKFSYFNLEPPLVMGGIVAKVRDVLELHFKIDSSKIQGEKLVISDLTKANPK